MLLRLLQTADQLSPYLRQAARVMDVALRLLQTADQLSPYLRQAVSAVDMALRFLQIAGQEGLGLIAALVMRMQRAFGQRADQDPILVAVLGMRVRGHAVKAAVQHRLGARHGDAWPRQQRNGTRGDHDGKAEEDSQPAAVFLMLAQISACLFQEFFHGTVSLLSAFLPRFEKAVTHTAPIGVPMSNRRIQ